MPEETALRVVLIIDDEPEIVTMLARTLRERGYAVLVPPHGFTARQIAGLPFDLLLTDLVMPDVSGFDIIQTVRTERPDSAIIAFSGHGMRMPETLGRDVIGADLFLSKPMRADALVKAIDGVIADKVPQAPRFMRLAQIGAD